MSCAAVIDAAGATQIQTFINGEVAKLCAVNNNGLANARESLVVGRDAGARMILRGTVSFTGLLAIQRGEYRRGALLLGRGDAGTGSWWLLPDQRRAHEESVVATRAAVGEDDFATAWVEGQKMTLEDAVELALAERDRESLQ